MSDWIKKLSEKYAEQQEAMDPVNKAELKGKHKDRKDKDIDNDGDVDSSDEYLHKRRKAISKDEGNAFTKALMAARKAGDKTFVVGNKSYSCEDYDENGKLKEAYNEPQGQAKRMMSPLQKMRMDKEKADRDRDGKLKPGVIKKEDQDLDEISMSKLGRYSKAAAKDVAQKRNKVKAALDQPASVKHAKAGMKAMQGLTKRSKGSDMYVNKMTGRSKVKPTAEAYENIPKATHKGQQDPQGKGLSPSAKDQLAKKMPTPEPIDEPKVDAKNFKTFRKGLKQAKKRPGDK